MMESAFPFVIVCLAAVIIGFAFQAIANVFLWLLDFFQ